MRLQKLEIQFMGAGEVKGFEFAQISSSSAAYTYEVKINGQIHYETFKRENSPICIDFSQRLFSETEFKEIYPKAKKFGVSAWSFKSREKAIEKFSQISE